MNETIKTILNRRSTRAYLNEQLKPEELDLIIKAGLFAPSGHNKQSWHFSIIQNAEIIKKINNDSKKEMLKQDNDYLKSLAQDENYNLFYNAPTVIVISGEKNAIVPNIDCAAATENMLIAAESLNIGTCWIGLVSFLFKSEKVKTYIKELKIPDGYEPYYAIAIGYKSSPAEQASPRRENTVNYIL